MPSSLSKKKDLQSFWAISWVSFLWSVATLMVFTLLPTFLTEELKATKMQLGLIEGTAIFLAFMAKVFSGVWSDFWQRRKPLIVMGTVMSLITKMLFALATNIWWVFAAKAVDRFSKGIRSAPTDALIADLSPKDKEGSHYGLRYTLYTLGAVCGGGVASLLIHVFAHDYRLVFWMALIPSTIALVLLLTRVHEAQNISSVYKKNQWHFKDIRKLPPVFWHLLIITSLLMFARFDVAFLNLRAKETGWTIALIPLLMIAYDLTTAAIALPIGRLADKKSRSTLLLMGIIVLSLANILIISVSHWTGIMLGILLAGLHMGMTQGLIASMIAQYTLPHLRGTAFALYYLSSGVCLLIGNTLAGYMADKMGMVGAFWSGLIFTSLSAIACFILRPKQGSERTEILQ